jgi:hypothetical protein
MPNFLVISSIGPALRMGSLRVVMVKPCLVMDVSAWPGATVSAGAPLSDAMSWRVCDEALEKMQRVGSVLFAASCKWIRWRGASRYCTVVGARERKPRPPMGVARGNHAETHFVCLG